MFKKPIIYIRIFKNQMEVKNVDTGKTIKRKAINNFSNDRLLISDFVNAENLMRSLIEEVSSSKFFKPSLKILLQPVDDNIKEITPVEHRTYLDSAEHAGGAHVIVYDKQEMLTDQQVLEFFSKSN